MNGAHCFARCLLAAVLLAGSVSAGASTVVYTSKSDWENALASPYVTERFEDVNLGPGVSFVSSESGHVNPALELYQDVLASNSQNAPMTTWTFTPRTTAYGGSWTLGGPGGSGNSLQVVIADSSELVGSIPNSFGGGFWGFISNVPFGSVKLIGGPGTNQQNYKLDDMVYAPVSVIPIPAAAWLFGSALIGLVVFARRTARRRPGH